MSPSNAPDSPGPPLPLEALPIAIACFQLGGEFRLRRANGLFLQGFGRAATEGSPLSDWLAPTYPIEEYRDRVLQQWHSAADQARGGGLGTLQCRLMDSGGSQLEVLVQMRCQGEELVATFQDVTARSRAEAELEEAQASLAQTALAITESIPVGTYTMVMAPDRPVAYFSFMSERFLEICGLDRARARENPLEGFACVHPDDYDDWLRINAEAFAQKRPFKGECRVVVEGQTRWISAESVPRDLPDGSTVWEGVLIDISERVLAQQRLQTSERRLRRLLDNLPVPMVSLGSGDPAAEVFCNRRFLETFGYGAERLQDREAWLEQAFPEPHGRALVQQSWEQAKRASDSNDSPVTAGEFPIRCADGEQREVLISATSIDDLVVATLLDITERKRSERALAEAREREKLLEEQQRLRLEQKLRTSLTAAAVAHEINQPLSAILLQAKMALQQLEQTLEPSPGRQRLQETLNTLGRDAERVVEVMGKMRGLLRSVQTEPQAVDLANVVESALLFKRPRLHQAGVELRCQGLEAPCPIGGDADQLLVAVSNLVRNALDSLEGMPAPQRVLEVSLERREGRVALSVADSGGGFPEGVLDGLPLTTTKPDGTGLGLYLVQTTAENHGGGLAFGRSPLGGAQVTLILPAALPPGPAAAAAR